MSTTLSINPLILGRGMVLKWVTTRHQYVFHGQCQLLPWHIVQLEMPEWQASWFISPNWHSSNRPLIDLVLTSCPLFSSWLHTTWTCQSILSPLLSKRRLTLPITKQLHLPWHYAVPYITHLLPTVITPLTSQSFHPKPELPLLD
jgi:hypothetical protein